MAVSALELLQFGGGIFYGQTNGLMSLFKRRSVCCSEIIQLISKFSEAQYCLPPLGFIDLLTLEEIAPNYFYLPISQFKQLGFIFGIFLCSFVPLTHLLQFSLQSILLFLPYSAHEILAAHLFCSHREFLHQFAIFPLQFIRLFFKRVLPFFCLFMLHADLDEFLLQSPHFVPELGDFALLHSIFGGQSVLLIGGSLDLFLQIHYGFPQPPYFFLRPSQFADFYLNQFPIHLAFSQSRLQLAIALLQFQASLPQFLCLKLVVSALRMALPYHLQFFLQTSQLVLQQYALLMHFCGSLFSLVGVCAIGVQFSPKQCGLCLLVLYDCAQGLEVPLKSLNCQIPCFDLLFVLLNFVSQFIDDFDRVTLCFLLLAHEVILLFLSDAFLSLDGWKSNG